MKNLFFYSDPFRSLFKDFENKSKILKMRVEFELSAEAGPI